MPMIMKKIKRWVQQIHFSKVENRELISDATIQAHRFLSGIMFVTFLLYSILITVTDYVLWGTWNSQHLYTLFLATVAGVNWIIYAKPVVSKNNVTVTANIFLLIVLVALAAGRSMGGGYVSYTLAVCASVATIVMNLNPSHYSLLALIAMISEICFNCKFLGGDSVSILYYGVDAFVIFAVTSCLNFFCCLLRYQIFHETNALRTENSTDALTGLYNRKYFEHYFRFHYRGDELSALLHIDLDNFKMVNDTMGHQEGDQLLIDVAKILQDNFQASNCVARVGGDEFMVFMPALSDAQIAYDRVQSLLNCFPIIVEREGAPKPVHVSVSIGVVFSDRNGTCSYAQLYEKADEAMYQAKKSGKGKAVFSDLKGKVVEVKEITV